MPVPASLTVTQWQAGRLGPDAAAAFPAAGPGWPGRAGSRRGQQRPRGATAGAGLLVPSAAAGALKLRAVSGTVRLFNLLFLNCHGQLESSRCWLPQGPGPLSAGPALLVTFVTVTGPLKF